MAIPGTERNGAGWPGTAPNAGSAASGLIAGDVAIDAELRLKPMRNELMRFGVKVCVSSRLKKGREFLLVNPSLFRGSGLLRKLLS